MTSLTTSMWNLKNKTQLIDTENRMVATQRVGEWGVGVMGEGVQEVQTSSYKISNSWVYNVQDGDYSQ